MWGVQESQINFLYGTMTSRPSRVRLFGDHSLLIMQLDRVSGNQLGLGEEYKPLVCSKTNLIIFSTLIALSYLNLKS